MTDSSSTDIDAPETLARRYVAWWNEQNGARPGTETMRIVDGLRLRVSRSVFSPDVRLTYAPTLMCEVMPDSLRGKRVLDLGTGCGVLAITAAVRGAERVVAVDLSEDAIADTTANVASHEQAGRIGEGVVVPALGDLYDALPDADAGPFDLILANLPIAAEATPWHELGPIADLTQRAIAGLSTHLRAGGTAMFGWASFGPPGVMPDLLDQAGYTTEMTHAKTFGVTWSICAARRPISSTA
ncbi:MAG: methyltransferase [Planctomycetota bacterium]